MRDVLNKILENYVEETSNAFKNNELAHFIRNEAIEEIQEMAKIDIQHYYLKGSAGQGGWGSVPWIGIFDRDITISAQKGYDIVYLFNADMSGVYISLNQGWTYFKDKFRKEAKDKISLVSEAWKNKLSSSLNDFSFESIELHSEANTDLPKGYELGHICGKFYERGNLPSNSELINDLRNLMGVLRELKGNLIEGSFEKTNMSLLSEIELGLIENRNDKQLDSSIDNIISGNFKEFNISQMEAPSKFDSYSNHDFNSGRKANYVSKAKNNTKIGSAGEMIVLYLEIKKLKEANKYSLAKKVEHVSKTKGDGLGYDILSYDINGNMKYIEVKTTTGDEKSPFYISRNEIEFSATHSKDYQLYRVYDLDTKRSTAKYYIVNGDITISMKFTPTQYISSEVN